MRILLLALYFQLVTFQIISQSFIKLFYSISEKEKKIIKKLKKIIDGWNLCFGIYVVLIAALAFTGVTNLDCKMIFDLDYNLI